MERPWSDLGATLERPWSDFEATLGDPVSLAVVYSRPALGGCSESRLSGIEGRPLGDPVGLAVGYLSVRSRREGRKEKESGFVLKSNNPNLSDGKKNRKTHANCCMCRRSTLVEEPSLVRGSWAAMDWPWRAMARHGQPSVQSSILLKNASLRSNRVQK